eukprot:GHVO01046047.1.p1 GENE.GHVO01046047.1~~GHVO01046047.1.p1  ORF type:complete len:167 (+),score=13.78 GHVO01046047.1:30-530(+)
MLTNLIKYERPSMPHIYRHVLRRCLTHYTATHEYLRDPTGVETQDIMKRISFKCDDIKLVGISKHGSTKLGDIVFCENVFYPPGATVKPNDILTSLESIKAVGDVNCPVDGTYLISNAAVAEAPSIITQDPEGKGWLAAIAVEDLARYSESLMPPEKYLELCANDN